MTHGSDAENDVAILKEPDGAVGLADNDGHGPGHLGDGRGGPVPRAQTLGEGQPGHGSVDQPAGGLDRAIPGHDEGAVHLGDLLDRLTNAGVADVALLAAIALKRVEAQRTRARQDVARIADDDQGADGLPLAALAADLDGRIDHGLEGLKRDGGLERPEVVCRETLQVLTHAY